MGLACMIKGECTSGDDSLFRNKMEYTVKDTAKVIRYWFVAF